MLSTNPYELIYILSAAIVAFFCSESLIKAIFSRRYLSEMDRWTEIIFLLFWIFLPGVNTLIAIGFLFSGIFRKT